MTVGTAPFSRAGEEPAHHAVPAKEPPHDQADESRAADDDGKRHVIVLDHEVNGDLLGVCRRKYDDDQQEDEPQDFYRGDTKTWRGAGISRSVFIGQFVHPPVLPPGVLARSLQAIELSKRVAP
jgi:hypothetical protein